MLAPYGADEPITGVYALLERWCQDKVKQAIAAGFGPNPGTSGAFLMPDITGRWAGLVSEEQCYRIAFAGQRGCYALWALGGLTVQMTGGNSITIDDFTCQYVADGWGCSTDPGGLCTPCDPGVGSHLVDVPVPGRLYAISAQDCVLCPVSNLFEVPTLWILGQVQSYRPRYRPEAVTWRAIALLEPDPGDTADTMWGRLATEIDISDAAMYDDVVGSPVAPPDEVWKGRN